MLPAEPREAKIFLYLQDVVPSKISCHSGATGKLLRSFLVGAYFCFE